MDKKTFFEKITKILESRKTKGRENFIMRAFVDPFDENSGELTINGAQITVVLSEQANLKYNFYRVDEGYLKGENRAAVVKQIKEQYPGIIFFACNADNDNESRTIDTENNLMVVENKDFDAAVDLCGGINQYIKTML